jgi:hypothetical protein
MTKEFFDRGKQIAKWADNQNADGYIVYTEVRYDEYVGFISSIHTEQMPYSNVKFTFDDNGTLIDAEFLGEVSEG